MANYCHLSYEDRKNIEDGLNEIKSINQIAKEINRSHSSILREIDRNKIYFESKQYGTYKNNNYDRDISFTLTFLHTPRWSYTKWFIT